MKISTINHFLSLGEIDRPGLFPHLDQLANAAYVFEVDFGLTTLPTEPGVLLIRGARQYGKSTWLENMVRETVIQFGPGTAFYLNGDFLLELTKLEQAIEDLLTGFHQHAPVKRIFIDEITAIPQWEIALKRLLDKGLLRDVLVVTTGSNATDIRRGAERLLGRKGKLSRTNYLFTPVSFQAFYKACYSDLGDKLFIAYLLSGGSPIACNALASQQALPEYVIELVRNWVDGEIARSGRNRQTLNNLLTMLFRFGGTPVAQAKFAREANLANNTVAMGYINLLQDLGIITQAFAWDEDKSSPILRKPCKYHFTNLLVAFAYNKKRIRTLDDFMQLPEAEQGMWLEWLTAQELLRLSAIHGNYLFEPQYFWQNKTHELDFINDQLINDQGRMIEVKREACSPLEFAWFVKQFPGKTLTVINKKRFVTNNIIGVTMEDFLSNNSLN